MRTEIIEDSGRVRREDLGTFEGRDFVSGVRVASISVPRGDHSVVIELRDSSGNIFAERLSRVVVDGAGVRTVVITRDCGGVSCPVASGDPNTSCLGSVCVAPECTVETPELCPPDACAMDGDCPPSLSECGAPRCNEGVCFMLARNELCAGNE